jgi:hypothetical protein
MHWFESLKILVISVSMPKSFHQLMHDSNRNGTCIDYDRTIFSDRACICRENNKKNSHEANAEANFNQGYHCRPTENTLRLYHVLFQSILYVNIKFEKYPGLW